MRTFIISFMLFLTAATCWGRDLASISSTDWLEKNLTGVTVIDIRKTDEYREGHIPGAINIMYGTLAIKHNNLDNELPLVDDLTDILNGAGLSGKSKVVVYNKMDNIMERANATRIALTLAYAGIGEVSVLDGGWNKWISESKPVVKEFATVKEGSERYTFDKKILIDRKQVLERYGKALFVDTRDPEFFFGAAKLPFVDKPGRIKGAVLLPSSWAFTKEGAFKPGDELQKYVSGVIGNDKNREMIVYCDSGRLASVWWYLLTQEYGYKNVKMYDGSSQDFMRAADFPIEQFRW